MKKCSFKQQVKKANETILNDNKEWYENFVKENFPQTQTVKNKKRNKSGWLVVCTALAVIVAVVSVCAWFREDSSNKTYRLDRESVVQSDLAELNKSTKEVYFNISDMYDSTITRTYDLDSGDTLYFILRLSNEDITYETINLWVYVNPYYNERKGISDVALTKGFENYSVAYVENINGEEPIYDIEYNAIIKYKNIEVYVEYSQLSLEEQGRFFEFVQGFFTPLVN